MRVKSWEESLLSGIDTDKLIPAEGLDLGRRCDGMGPKNAKIAIVGDFPGDDDLTLGMPFNDWAGRELTKLLGEVGINRGQCYMTTVFKHRPPAGELENWCVAKRQADEEWAALSGLPKAKYPFPIYKAPGKYIRPEIGRAARDELKAELSDLPALNLVIALGNVASWALLDTGGISNLRGTCANGTLVPVKVLPTHNPKSILQQWDLRAIATIDLQKALREAEFPELRIPPRELWINPSFDEIKDFFWKHIVGCPLLSVDIETESKQVTCIGFAPDKYRALVIPFWNKNKPGWSHWATVEEEAEAYRWVNAILDWPVPKLYQNGLYDLQFMLRCAWRMSALAPAEDTMLLHHALQPELQKGLGFLGSLYTDTPAWKKMRKQAKAKEAFKSDE